MAAIKSFSHCCCPPFNLIPVWPPVLSFCLLALQYFQVFQHFLVVVLRPKGEFRLWLLNIPAWENVEIHAINLKHYFLIFLVDCFNLNLFYKFMKWNLISKIALFLFLILSIQKRFTLKPAFLIWEHFGAKLSMKCS